MAKAAKGTVSMSVDYQTKNMQALRGSRTAKEFRKVLDTIVDSTLSIKIPNRIMSLSAKSGAVVLDDIVGTPSKVVKKLDLVDKIDLSKLDISDIRAKAKYNSQVAVLTQAIAELGIAYQILNSRTFAAFKDQDKASANLLNVIKEAKELQNSMVRLMSIDVKNGAPPEHKRLAASVSNYMAQILNKEQYSKIVSRTFIASGLDPITFQTFIYVKDFVNSSGTLYPHYSAVLSTEIQVATGAAQHFVTTLVDEKVPGSFPIGRVVATAPELKKALNSLLAVDGFLNYGEKMPIQKSTQQLRDTSMLGSTTHQIRGRNTEIIESVRVQNDFLYVRLVRGLTGRERRDALQEVLAMASTVLKGRRKGDLVYQFETGRNGAEYIKIALSRAKGQTDGIITVAQINKIAEQLQLNKEQISALKQSVK